MLSENSQTQEEKTASSHLYVESKKVKYIEAERRTVVIRGEEVGEMGRRQSRAQSGRSVGCVSLET